MKEIKREVVVLGGGFAGCAAALAAARSGCKVLLLEQSGALGGAANVNLIKPFMPYWHRYKDGRKRVYLSRGIFAEIVQNMRAVGGMSEENDSRFEEEYLKVVLDRMLAEAGVEVLFHVTLVDAVREGRTLKSLHVASKAGVIPVFAERFIDCSGDADLTVAAGLNTHLGREDNLCQPMTLCFRIAPVDVEKFLSNFSQVNAKYKELKAAGKIKNPREDVLPFHDPVPNVLHLNSTRIVRLNPVDPFDVSRAEREAREQELELLEFLRTYAPGCENAKLLMSANAIGVRESRMIDGEYRLTGDDLINCRKFDDAIAAGNYDIDIHNPEGSGTSHHFFEPGTFYTIPYRSLIPKECDNLLVAGRCISSDHEAQASYRIMPIVCTLGQAAGVATAVAQHAGVASNRADVKEIQKILIENGAYIGQDEA